MELSDDFFVQDAPALDVFLSTLKRHTPSSINLGRLQEFTGAQSYEVPDTVALDSFDFVLIHCLPFSVRGAGMRMMQKSSQTPSRFRLALFLFLIGYLPFRRLVLNKQVGRPSGFVYFGGDDVTGIADAEIGLRGLLLKSGAHVVSAGLILGLPLGDDDHFNGLVTGDGEFNQRLTLQWGYSLHPAYLAADLGIDNHTDGFADEWVYSAEVGYSFRPELMLILRTRGSESRKNGDDSISGGMGGLYANNKRYLSYGPELVYSVDTRMGLSLSALRSARTRNALVAPAFSLSLFYKH